MTAVESLHSALRSCSIARSSVLAAALLALVGLPTTVGAQSRQLWYRTYDGPALGDDVGREVVLGNHGEAFVIGNSSNGPNADVLVLAYSGSGTPLWERRIDLGGQETGVGIAYDAATGALFALGNRATFAGMGAASFAWRLDPANGAILWEQALPSTPLTGTIGRELAVDATGGLVVGAHTSGFFSPLTVLIVRYDASGTPTWSWTGSGGYVQSLAPDVGGDLFVQTVDTGSARRFFRLDTAGTVVWTRTIGTTDLGCIGPLPDAQSNVVYSINEGAFGGYRIAKLDPAGNPLWSVLAPTLFGTNGSTYGLTTDAQGNVFAVGTNSRVVRLDPNGNVVWSVVAPPSQWFDIGLASSLDLAPNGNIVLRVRGDLPMSPFRDYDAILCFDPAGTFLWSQAIRGGEALSRVETYGLSVTRQGSVVVAGQLKRNDVSPYDLLVATVRPQSSVFCVGDGSAGPCPCGNESAAGYAGGCLRTGTFLGPRLDDQGIASVGTDSLRFFATGLANNGLCVLIQGQPAANATPFEDGLLCLTGSLTRLHLGPATGAILDLPANGAPSIHALSASLGQPIAPGSTRGYQIYYRGGTGLCSPTNGNWSNGVRVTWEL